ncbi:MAG: tRNA (guanine(46)-N(7))-methyltransferase TrmB, partial [Pseudomonadota bacterium]
GKALRARQQAMLDEFLPQIAVPGAAPPGDPARAAVDLRALFGDRPVWLEIGFGAGEHLLAQAAAHPEIGLIGAEHFLNGLASCLSHLERAGLRNIRIHGGDVHDLLEVLPPASLARVFLLYPDPWPKTRHAGRRFVNPPGMDRVARVMAPGARFHLATDIPEYVAHARAHMAGRSEFAPVDHPLHAAWAGWHPTRYEAKALREGRVPHYLIWERR